MQRAARGEARTTREQEGAAVTLVAKETTVSLRCVLPQPCYAWSRDRAVGHLHLRTSTEHLDASIYMASQVAVG